MPRITLNLALKLSVSSLSSLPQGPCTFVTARPLRSLVHGIASQGVGPKTLTTDGPQTVARLSHLAPSSPPCGSLIAGGRPVTQNAAIAGWHEKAGRVWRGRPWCSQPPCTPAPPHDQGDTGVTSASASRSDGYVRLYRAKRRKGALSMRPMSRPLKPRYGPPEVAPRSTTPAHPGPSETAPLGTKAWPCCSQAVRGAGAVPAATPVGGATGIAPRWPFGLTLVRL